MKHRARSVLGLAMPVRATTQRFAFLFLVLAAFGLMLLGKADTVLVERVRAGIIDVVAPIMDVLSQPAATVAEVVESGQEMANLKAENERLRAQNARLLEWQAAARRLAAENAAFRNLLNYVPGASPRFITGRVIADSGRVFKQSMLVNAGAQHGVVKGQAVITGDGLAGRITSVGARSARVLLITDFSSQIPVIFETTRERAILAGDNDDRPTLRFHAYDGNVSVGDRIVTSGHGGALPPGLPVGTVAAVEDGVISVQPFADLRRMEYVRIVDFDGPEPVEPAGGTRGAAEPR